MTMVLWSNAGRHEFLLHLDGGCVARSGLVYPSRSAAKRGALAKAATLQ